MDILLTIRNQADLISSCFLQKYRFLVKDSNGMDFGSFIKDEQGCIRKVTSNIFNFKKVADHYRVTFNGTVSFLFFEDLKSDKEHFFQTLSTLLKVESNLIESLISDAHFRNRAKAVNGKGFTSVFKPKGIGIMVSSMMGHESFRIFMNRLWYMRYSVFLKYFRKSLVKDYSIRYPGISREEKDFIRNHFSESNTALASEYGLDIGRMKLYGYINDHAQ